jgi:nucleotide-binding universal stress UspA family protein
MRILIPTDGGVEAQAAIDFATALCSGRSTEFVLLGTYDMPVSPDLPMMPDPEITATIDGVLARQCDQLSARHKGEAFHFSHNVLAGGLTAMAVWYMEHNHIDMVAMGTAGTKGLWGDLMGSNTADMIAVSHCPVLVIPKGATYNGLTHIALATDNAAVQRAGVIEPMLDLAKRHDASVTVVNVLPPDAVTSVDEAVEGLRTDHRLQSVRHDFRFLHGTDRAEAILKFIHGVRTDLLCVTHRHSSLLSSLFHHSVSSELTRHSDIPLLVLEA